MSKKSARTPRKSDTSPVAAASDDQDERLVEPSSVHCPSPNATYPNLFWSREHALKSLALTRARLQANFPHGFNQHGELTLVAKTRFGFRKSLSDKVGIATKSSLQLQADHLGRSITLDSFVFLGFEPPKCFFWSTNFQGAVRLGYDAQSFEAIYMARASDKRKPMERIFSVTGSEISSQMELLCLKGSPKSLKCLVRDYLRTRRVLNRDNLAIERFEIFLDSDLLRFVKFSNRLRVGRELRRGDSIISRNLQYRLSLECNGHLVLYIDSTRKKFLFLYDEVESLWFNELAVVVCDKQLSTKPFPNATTSSQFDMIGGFLRRIVESRDSSAVLRITDQGTLEITGREIETKLVIQYRDDVQSMWNTEEPCAECACYLAPSRSPETQEQDDFSSSSSTSSEDDGSSYDSSEDDADLVSPGRP